MLLVGTLVALLAWGWTLAGTQRPDGSRDAHLSPAIADSAVAPPEDVSRDPTTPPARREVVASVRARGRCVSAEEAAPLAGCLVQVTIVLATAPGAAEDEDTREVEQEVTTGADGSFDLQVDVPPDAAQVRRAYCSAVRFDRARVLAYASRDGASVLHLDFGRLVLPRGAHLRGVVVDEAGLPVPGASLSLTDMVLPGVMHVGSSAISDYELLEAGPDGQFSSDAPLAFGTWLAEYDTPGRYLASPPELVFRDASQQFRVVLAQAAVLRGFVVDEQGQPIEGADVRAIADSWEPWSTESRPDGTFELIANRKVEGEVNVLCSSSAHESIADSTAVRWGQSDIRIVMRPKLRGALRLRVIAQGSQQPVEAQVRIGSSKATTDAAGFAVIDELAVGSHDCTVRPTDPRLRPVVVQKVEISASSTTERLVQIAALEPLEVRVQDTARRAIAAARVRVADAGVDWPYSRDYSTVRIDLPRSPADVESERRNCLILAEAQTDATGHCTLSGPAQGNDGILLVEAPGHLALQAAAPWPRDANGHVTLTLSAGAAMRGELRNLDPAWTGAIRLSRPEPAMAPPQTAEEAEAAAVREHLRTWRNAHATRVAANGHFELDLLEPGPWEVTVLVQPLTVDRSGASLAGTPLPLSIEPVSLVPGRTTELTIDAGAMRSGTIRGWLTFRGEVPAACTLRIGRETPGSEELGWIGDTWSTEVGHTGQFELRGLPPGTWHANVSLGMDWRRQRDFDLDDVWTVRSGETLERRVEVPVRMVRVKLLNRDRTPAAGVQVGLAGLLLMATTDSDGTAVFGPCPRRHDHVVTVEPTVLHEIEFPLGGGELFREVILK